MITLEILKSVAEKYRKAIETGEVPDQLQMGLCYSISFEINPDTDAEEWNCAFAWAQFLYKKNYVQFPTDWDKFNGTNHIEHLKPRLEWLEARIKEMEDDNEV